VLTVTPFEAESEPAADSWRRLPDSCQTAKSAPISSLARSTGTERPGVPDSAGFGVPSGFGDFRPPEVRKAQSHKARHYLCVWTFSRELSPNAKSWMLLIVPCG
jgi:hypothetical protein